MPPVLDFLLAVKLIGFFFFLWQKKTCFLQRELFYFWKEIKTSIHCCVHRSCESGTEKACLTECWSSLTPFSPGDGWVILYTINPSICQLLMEILGLLPGGEEGFRQLSGHQRSCVLHQGCCPQSHNQSGSSRNIATSHQRPFRKKRKKKKQGAEADNED